VFLQTKIGRSKVIKKSSLFMGAAAIVGAMVFSPVAAQAAGFDCNKAAIWAYDGDTKHVTKINPFGHVVSTITLAQPDGGTGSGDVSIDASYHHIYLINPEDGVESYNPTTGAMDAGYPKAITGDFNQSSWSFAAGVINGGHIIANSGQDSAKLYSIDPATGASVQWADITNAEAGLPAGATTGGTWTTGADIVQAADGSVYVLADNSNYPNSLLVKINPANTTQMTVLGEMPDSVGKPWGMARAGDNYYVTDGNGEHIFQLGGIGTTASVAKLTGEDAGHWAGISLWGLAGTNDSDPSLTHCVFNLATGGINGAPALAATGGSISDYYAEIAGGIALAGLGAALTFAARRQAAK
jgi:hypothetical protein